MQRAFGRARLESNKEEKGTVAVRVWPRYILCTVSVRSYTVSARFWATDTVEARF